MRIERAQHAVDRRVDEVLVGDLGSVVFVGDLHQLGELADLGLGIAGNRQQLVAEEGPEEDRKAEEDDRGVTPGSAHGAELYQSGGSRAAAVRHSMRQISPLR